MENCSPASPRVEAGNVAPSPKSSPISQRSSGGGSTSPRPAPRCTRSASSPSEYSENGAHTRLQVARLCSQFPAALEALETGTIHLTGLALLCPKVTEANAQELLDEARGKTRREIEALLARRFPRPDVLPSITPLQRALLEQGNSGPVTQSEQFAPTAPASPEPAPPRPRVEPLSLEPREAGHRTGPKRRRRPRRRAIASGRPGGLGLSLATASRMTVEPRCPRGSRSWATPSSGVRLVSKGAFSWRIRQ